MLKYNFKIIFIVLHLIILGLLVLAIFDYAKIFLYEVLNILDYLGELLVIAFIILVLFIIKVMEKVNNEIYLPKKNNLIHGMVAYILIFTGGVPYFKNELYFAIKKDYVVKFLHQVTSESKCYINNQLSKEKEVLKRFSSILKTVSQKPSHRSKNMHVSKPTNNSIHIQIVNKSKKLTIEFRQDNAWSYEYWIYVDGHGFVGQVHAYDIEEYIYNTKEANVKKAIETFVNMKLDLK